MARTTSSGSSTSAVLVTVPISSVASRFGTWNFHFGADYFRLGETTHSIQQGRATTSTSPSKFVGVLCRVSERLSR